MKTKDYYFKIVWRDGFEKNHNIGILARINDVYYLKGQDIEKNQGTLFFKGIPPHYDTKLHKSKDLFPFFKMKVLANGGASTEDLCELLEERLGKNHIDSYSVEKIEDEQIKANFKKLIECVKRKGKFIPPIQSKGVGKAH